jgi:hypothetical protein
MKAKFVLAAPLAALLMIGAANAEPAKKAPARQCFWARDVDGFAAADDKTVNVRVGVHDVYQFEMFGHCNDVDWAEKIAIVSRGGSSLICSGLDADLIVPSTIGPQRCPISHMRKLTPEEIAVLPKHGKP